MSTNPLTYPYQCETPGCTQKFEKPEHLHQHIKDSHSPSGSLPSRRPPKQPTFKCGAPGCQAAPFPQLPLLHEHTAQAHSKSNISTPSSSPPSKQPTFKCGALGCGAAPFLELSLLHQHTAQAHPKSNISTPSGSPLSKPPTFKCGAPGCGAPPFLELSLLHQHTAQAHPKSNISTPSGSPLSKPPTFKCGAPGCGAPPFLELSLLHQHTAQAHPKSNISTPSGSPPPKQPTFKCGAPGCGAAPFPQLLLLHEHTAQAHPKSNTNTPSSSLLSKPPTFKCGAPGCGAPPFLELSLLHQHTAQAHPKSNISTSSGLPLSKPPTFKCGAPGCGAAPFPQLLLLHEHTAQAHPKSNKNATSGSSTLAFSTQGHLVTNTSTEAPLSMTQHVPLQVGYLPPPSRTANEAQYVSPYIYSRQSSPSTSLAAQNAVSSPDHASAAFVTDNELMQRLAQLAFRQMMPVIDKSMLKVGMHFVELAEDIIRSSMNDRRISFRDRLHERVEWMSKHNNVRSLAYSAKFRADVWMLLYDFGYKDPLKIQKIFLEDDQVIAHLFRQVIHSGKEEISHLNNEEATGFMDELHKCIMASDDAPFVLEARRLLKDLCTTTKAFPPTLYLKLDSVNTNRQIGRGGFADIFLGKYKGQDIALKRLQVYQPRPNEMLEFSKNLLQEVLTWVHLKHIYVLPFFGLDEKTFEGYPPCIITPYMRNGTMNDFVKNRSGMLPDRQLNQLLFETAQGLAYLHSQNIVHGDLRGGNVLIDDGEHAQLADFGLAIVTDATLGTTSTTQAGSFSDVYAFACLCIEIYTGEQPFWSIQPDIAFRPA
ncbi:Kinase-like protein [Mycena venus]|uniref:Kinase-like protein n=1 Tax=Mycena venus TaxID=2733690 RepID=A0A8H6YBK6_9AGAR|nr:Kinase-like protein [Mycena venus]